MRTNFPRSLPLLLSGPLSPSSSSSRLSPTLSSPSLLPLYSFYGCFSSFHLLLSFLFFILPPRFFSFFGHFLPTLPPYPLPLLPPVQAVSSPFVLTFSPSSSPSTSPSPSASLPTAVKTIVPVALPVGSPDTSLAENYTDGEINTCVNGTCCLRQAGIHRDARQVLEIRVMVLPEGTVARAHK